MLDNRAYEENSGAWRWSYWIEEDALDFSNILWPYCATLSFVMKAKLILIWINRHCATSVTIHERTPYSKETSISYLQCTANRELLHFASVTKKIFFSGLAESIFRLKKIIKVPTAFVGLWNLISSISQRFISRTYSLEHWGHVSFH